MMNIYLIGYMCSGKSTVGRLLSQRLGMRFCDIDDEIERCCNAAVSQIFAKRGEVEFRQLERKMLIDLCDMDDVVVAAGGGTPCFFDNMRLMRSSGKVVYLRLSDALLAERILATDVGSRPLLADCITADDMRCRVEEQMNMRRQFYEQADVAVGVDVADMLEDVVKKIIKALKI